MVYNIIMTELNSDGINRGRPHPNRPLPSFDFSLGSDLETRREHPEVLVAATEGIYDVIELMRRKPEFDTQLIGQEETLTEMLEAFRQRNPNTGLEQINVEEFVYHLAREGALDPRQPIYLLTAKDLFEPRLNFMFGITVTGLGVSVQSHKRFEDVSRDPRWLEATARHMARHEFGHLVGLNRTTISNPDTREGIYQDHCTNLCTMQQVMSVNETGRLIYRLEEGPNAGFCDDCVGSLAMLGASR